MPISPDTHQTVGFALPNEDIYRLAQLSRTTGKTRAELLREIISKTLDDLKIPPAKGALS